MRIVLETMHQGHSQHQDAAKCPFYGAPNRPFPVIDFMKRYDSPLSGDISYILKIAAG
jgi:hypothetical protein